MSGIVEEYFDAALLAQASYATGLSPELQDAEIEELLKATDTGMSSSQATQFTEQFKVIDHQANTDSGFSATVFQNKETGEYIFSMRGTEVELSLDTYDDLISADIGDIGFEGIAAKQAIDIFNYYQRLTTDVGSELIQYEYHPLNIETGEVANVSFTKTTATEKGAFVDVDLSNSPLTVAGHSLGGHLAMIMSRFSPDQVDSVFTYNAVDFDPLTSGTNDFFTLLRNAETTAKGSSEIASAFDINKFNAITVPADLVSEIGTVNGAELAKLEIFSETDDPGLIDAIAAHSSLEVTDALAVYNLFSKISAVDDTQVNSFLQKTTNILKASSDKANESLENIVNALGDLIGVGTKVNVGNRDELYTRLQAIEDVLIGIDGNVAALHQGLEITSLHNALASEIKVKALGLGLDYPDDAIAYRYALLNLNPFVITTDNNSIYDSHNVSGELELENFSEDYLTDVSEFLALKNDLSLEDRNSKTGTNISTKIYQKYDDNGALDFEFKISGIGPGGPRNNFFIIGGQGADNIEGGERNDHLYGNGGEDELNGNEGNDHIEGNHGNDILVGGTGKDTLVGGTGNDILYHNENIDSSVDDNAQDILKGGAGNDTYYVGDGDVLEDSDRQGSINFDGIDISGTYTQLTVNSYKNAATGIVIAVNGTRAIIQHIDEDITTSFRIENFQDPVTGFIPGNLGITLGSSQTLPETDEVINGTEEGEIFANDFNSELVIPTSDVAEVIYAFGGDDTINPAGGDDVVFAGQGDDLSNGGAGNDLIFGEGGSDRLNGWEGDDFIDGGTERDVITGQTGDDVLNGGDGVYTDVLFGGIGADILSGGEGDDYLFGDLNLIAEKTSWTITPDPEDPRMINFFSFAGTNPIGEIDLNDSDIIFGNEGNDYISGESGDDRLFGNKGNDVLLGGNGNDELYGGADDDILDGGLGNDLLDGGTGDDTYYFDSGDTVIRDAGGSDTLILNGVGVAELVTVVQGNDLQILIGTDALIIEDWATSPIEFFQLPDASGGSITLDKTDIDVLTNQTPIVVAPLSNQVIDEDSDFNFTIPTTTFTDPDVGDTLTYSASLADDSALPDWLEFDPATQTLSGTPINEDVGVVDTRITVTDEKGGAVSNDFSLTVNNTNDVPIAVDDEAIIELELAESTVIPSKQFSVATHISGHQYQNDIIGLVGGGFVVVWASNDSATGDPDAFDPLFSYGITGQRFDSDGRKVGKEFLINNKKEFVQDQPSVSALDNGGFVVVWSSWDSTTGDSFIGISGRIFEANGVAMGREFLVNTTTAGDQYNPSVTTLVDGSFVVLWQTPGISGQRFSATGEKLGNEYLLSDSAAGGDDNVPKIASLASGEFIAVWTDNTENVLTARGQRFSADGDTLGDEIPVNQFFRKMSVAGLNDGGYVVVSINTDPENINQGEIMAQLFNAIDEKVGDEIIVNMNQQGSQDSPDVTAQTDGGFVITWFTENKQIAGQRFDAQGQYVGVEFQVNASGSSLNTPVVAGLEDGGFATAWGITSQILPGFSLIDPNAPTNADSIGIKGRVFLVPPVDSQQIIVDVLANDTDVDLNDEPANFTLDSVSLQGNKGQISIFDNRLLFNTLNDFNDLRFGDEAQITVDYTMSDGSGASSSASLTIAVRPENDAPTLANVIADQTTDEDADYTYTVPVDTFNDIDIINGDILTYSAALVSGSNLPAWLSFDADTQTFSGNAPVSAIGNQINVQVTATDIYDLSASDVFSLSITGQRFNVIYGDGIPNSLVGTASQDAINGFGGNDDLNGLGGDDVIIGGGGKDILKGGAGDDRLFGNGGNDRLKGGSGNDKLHGGSGADRLFGGRGYDKLRGGKGGDTYFFNRGGEIDEIREKGGKDVLRFGEGIVANDLWFWKDNDDLNLGINGTEDRIKIDDWYTKDSSRVEVFKLRDGMILLENQVQQLVDAMAVFDVSTAGQLNVPQDDIDATQTAIATAWQSVA